MPYLIVHESGQRPRSFEITTDSVLAGRAPECELVVSNVAVSRNHFRISANGAQHVLDNLSENGTTLNDKPVDTTAFLKHRDVIRAGKFKLEYWNEDDCNPIERQNLQLMSPYTTARGSGEDSTHRISPEVQAQLRKAERIRDGAALYQEGTSLVYKPGGGKTTVGPKGKIPTGGSLLARSPIGELQWTGKGHVLRKIATFGGLTVNGSPPGNLPLRDGDRLVVANTTFVYRLPKDA